MCFIFFSNEISRGRAHVRLSFVCIVTDTGLKACPWLRQHAPFMSMSTNSQRIFNTPSLARVCTKGIVMCNERSVWFERPPVVIPGRQGVVSFCGSLKKRNFILEIPAIMRCLERFPMVPSCVYTYVCAEHCLQQLIKMGEMFIWNPHYTDRVILAFGGCQRRGGKKLYWSILWLISSNWGGRKVCGRRGWRWRGIGWV